MSLRSTKYGLKRVLLFVLLSSSLSTGESLSYFCLKIMILNICVQVLDIISKIIGFQALSCHKTKSSSTFQWL